MGKNARLRKLRREARRLGAPANTVSEFAKAHQKKYPEGILVSSPGAEKMSKVIEDFAEPLLEGVDSLEEMKKALLLAMTVWNYALVKDDPKAEPDEPLQEMLADPATRFVFDSLVERKRLLYPDNRRAILDFELTPKGSGFQFNVISTLA